MSGSAAKRGLRVDALEVGPRLGPFSLAVSTLGLKTRATGFSKSLSSGGEICPA
jgi:hypothetical protein